MHKSCPNEYMALTSNKTLITLLHYTNTFLYMNIKYLAYQLSVCLKYKTETDKGIKGLAVQQITNKELCISK